MTITAPGWCSSPETARANVARAVRSLMGAAAVDQPDRQALTDNPLVPFGGADR